MLGKAFEIDGRRDLKADDSVRAACRNTLNEFRPIMPQFEVVAIASLRVQTRVRQSLCNQDCELCEASHCLE
jgi:hypothetical protein